MNYILKDGVLYHHGIKGQKWGVRRSKEELNMDPESRRIRYATLLKNGIIAKNGIKVKSVSSHIVNETRRDRTQSPKDVVDAIRNPLKIDKIRYNDKGEPSIRYYGRKATANVNPEKGLITTAWKTGSKKERTK